jgi:sucrose-phosphate phosphatase-like hydrolase, Archaeal
VLSALVTDIDGTITDPARRIDTGALDSIRSLVDDGIEVVLASGNTPCFMDALCKMVGTKGTFIAENGGVYRIGYSGEIHVIGDPAVCRRALELVEDHFQKKGISLELHSQKYRYTDIAFARTVPTAEVKEVLSAQPVQVIDTGYLIHLQAEGVSKGSTLSLLARDLGLSPRDFFAIGDGINDAGMLTVAGKGVTLANAHPGTKKAASDVMDAGYGTGFVQAVKKYRPYLRAR